ncbi:YfmQ family protein [Kurthia sibirica]|uniref:Uncharacterized protein n=1 Tax=Kurthia sibirica TaxID=202750 RepID=A0A2U3APK0_9BACL|nr:YfmQ family protein [Kurthia sibirica]PWI26436.1 hypothetical protein DEX24_03640 [Kurthia sibirica]GEK33002.1 hypothetical protein KSI01_05350 [Kurthia sibirica]
MSWTVLLVIVIAGVAKLVTAPPNIVVVWLTSKFAMHQKFNADEVVVTFDGKTLEGTEKSNFIDSFNEASFLVRNSIFKGNEAYYIDPQLEVTPYIIHSKKGKKDMKLTVYYDHSKVEVIKQIDKSVLSYSLNSESLKAITNPTRIAV